MKKLFMVLLFLINVFMANPIMACIAFVAEDGDTVLVGNNEDWFEKYPIELKFEQSENGKYGRVYFIYRNLTQAGINNQGLMFDFFFTPFSSPEVTISKDKEEYTGKLMNKVLEECASVEQALKLIARYNLGFLKKHNSQVFIVDKTGDSAIIEGDNILRKKGRYQVVGMFHQSKIEEENKPCEFYKFSCSRYKTVIEMIDDRQNISVDGFRKMLQATHRSGLIDTLYSYIYDPKKSLLYVYYMHDFEKAVTISLDDELKKGNHSYDLSSLITKK
jgi:hypothetical protein